VNPKDVVLKHCGTGILGGATLGDWWCLLRENRFRIEPRYWPRAANVTLGAAVNSVVRRRERARYGGAVAFTDPPPPLFVLGVWRSGTTHLFNLLARDRRFAYPTTYEVINPHTCLSLRGPGGRLLDALAPPTRPMDAMRQGAAEPSEEDMALVTRGMSSMTGLVFPRRRDQYWRWVTLADVDAAGREAWKRAYLGFVRKVAYARGRPLLLKSPANTGRIGLLLELFPGARFVTIHRHPHAVYRSTRHTWRVTTPWWRLHRGAFDGAGIVEQYGELFDAYFAQRGLVPAGHLCEIAYEDLVADPLGTLAAVYRDLDLPDFEAARPAVAAYLDSLAGYRRNDLDPLEPGDAARLARRWRRAFTEWGYA